MSRQLQTRVKRLPKVSIATVVFALPAPVPPIGALLIRARSVPPVISSWERMGRWQQPFRIQELETVNDERGSEGQLAPGAERSASLGQPRRRLNGDAAPKRANVIHDRLILVNHMSPLRRYYPFNVGCEGERFLAPPNISDSAQVNGRNVVSCNHRLKCESQYATNWSIPADTADRVIGWSGNAVDPRAPMPQLDQERQLTGASS